MLRATRTILLALALAVAALVLLPAPGAQAALSTYYNDLPPRIAVDHQSQSFAAIEEAANSDAAHLVSETVFSGLPTVVDYTNYAAGSTCTQPAPQTVRCERNGPIQASQGPPFSTGFVVTASQVGDLTLTHTVYEDGVQTGQQVKTIIVDGPLGQSSFTTPAPATVTTGTVVPATLTVRNDFAGAFDAGTVDVALTSVAAAPQSAPAILNPTATLTPAGGSPVACPVAASPAGSTTAYVARCAVGTIASGGNVTIAVRSTPTGGRGTVTYTASTVKEASLRATTSTVAAAPATSLRVVGPTDPVAVLSGVATPLPYTVTNTGTVVAHDVHLVPTAYSPLAQGSTVAVGDLAPGASRSVPVTYTAVLGAYEPTRLDYADGSRNVDTSVTTSDDSTSSAITTFGEGGRLTVFRDTLASNLSLVGVPGEATALPGDVVTFRYTLRSTGSAPVTGIHIPVLLGLPNQTVTLGGTTCPPLGSSNAGVNECELAALAPGSTTDLVVTATIPDTTVSANLVLYGRVATDSFSDLSASMPETVFVAPGHIGYVEVLANGFDLQTSATATSSGAAGAPITFAASVTNAGRTATGAARLTAAVPGGTTVTGGDGCVPAAGVVVCDAGPLAPGASKKVSFTVSTHGAGTYATTFTASGAGPVDPATGMPSYFSRDAHPANDSATVAVTLGAGPAAVPGTGALVADVGALGSTRLAQAARKGLQVPTSCNQACRVTTTLTVTGKDAKRLGLKPKGGQPRPIGSGSTTTFTPGTLVVPIKLTAPAKRGVADLRGKKAVTAVLTTTVESVGGVLTRSTPVQLRR